MADKEVATDMSSDANSNPTQPSHPTPSAAADMSPSDPNLVSKVPLQLAKDRALFPQLAHLIRDSNTTGNMGWSR